MPIPEDVRELARAARCIVTWVKLFPECPVCDGPFGDHAESCVFGILERKVTPFKDQIDDP